MIAKKTDILSMTNHEQITDVGGNMRLLLVIILFVICGCGQSQVNIEEQQISFAEQMDKEVYSNDQCERILSYEYRLNLRRAHLASTLRVYSRRGHYLAKFILAERALEFGQIYDFCPGYSCPNGHIYDDMLDLWEEMIVSADEQYCRPLVLKMTAERLLSLRRLIEVDDYQISERFPEISELEREIAAY
jgi:hypothetical protein